MKQLKISIITPSYNQGQFIERTIESVLGQGYPNLEYIIIDGGSTDNSVDIIKKYSDRISYWISEKDHGQSDAINKGLKIATGDIVGWINSDDVLVSGSLDYINQYFGNNPDVDLLNGSVIEIDKQDNCLKIIYGIFSQWFAKHGSYNILQPSMVWRSQLTDKIGYLKNDYHACMDLEFLIRAYESKAKIKQTYKPIGAIRIYENTKTALAGSIWSEDAEKIRLLYDGHYLKKKFSVYFLLYVLCKLIKGYYFSMFVFKLKYKGKSISRINV